MLFLISLMSTKWKLLEMHVRFIIMTCIAIVIITEEPLYCMHMCSTQPIKFLIGLVCILHG